MNKHTSEAIFSEIVDFAKSGKSNRLPSADKAIIWAAEEIERLRAQVLAQGQDDVLAKVKAAEHLEELKFTLGVSDPVVVHGEKYSDSTYRGIRIDRIVYHAAGIVFIETTAGSFQFRIENKKPLDAVSGDFLLCELQFEPDLNLQ